MERRETVQGLKGRRELRHLIWKGVKSLRRPRSSHRHRKETRSVVSIGQGLSRKESV